MTKPYIVNVHGSTCIVFSKNSQLITEGFLELASGFEYVFICG